MEEDVEARGTPVPVPLKPGGALFFSNLTAHRSKLNTTQESRWSIDFRYFPTPDRADLTAEQRKEADFMETRKTPTLIVLSKSDKTTWEEWEAKSDIFPN
jgi:ectoine hydroxylase-related dioxygenase (phytanoyl-CoA dioxygenase family)